MKKVITYGSFDLFHKGHYKLLERAKKLGDYLIVGITTEHYDESRGKMNVIDSLLERIENVKKTGFADEIIIEDHAGQKVEDILKYNIDIFTVGSDWTGVFDYLKSYCEVVYLERTKDISSSLIREQKFGIIKMGVIGTGRIANRMVPEAKYVSGINIEAVYNPNLEHAQKFADKFQLEAAYNNLDDFFNRIDAVYIASPHETHYEYIKQALISKKHVLCEKPMVLSKKEAEELFEIAKENKIVLIEAIKTAYSPGFIELLDFARSGAIGIIRDIDACFTKLEGKDTRELTDLVYGGAFLELASYTMLPVVKIFGTKYKDVKFKTITSENGLDIYTKAEFVYEQGFATSKNGLGVKSEGELIISGTDGYIKVEAPWWKTKHFEICYEDIRRNERHSMKFLGDGIRYEISDFVTAIRFGKNLEFKLNKYESIFFAEIMEKFLQEQNRQG